jgi:hypothetical protein
MGGLIGIGLAALPGSPIGRLVLNDIGPAIDAAGLVRIAGYLGQPLTWGSEEEAADYLLTISQGFGPHSREEWLALTRPMLRQDGDRFRLHYDPAIAVPMRAFTAEMAAAGQAAIWAAFDAIRCPTLLLRGADSDLLSRATAEEMTRRGPKPRLHEFAAVGHAPTLVAPSQVAVVREFLLSPGKRPRPPAPRRPHRSSDSSMRRTSPARPGRLPGAKAPPDRASTSIRSAGRASSPRRCLPGGPCRPVRARSLTPRARPRCSPRSALRRSCVPRSFSSTRRRSSATPTRC